MTLPATESFLQRLRHSDYFVRDHRVHGVCTLPGVVLLDMVYRLSGSHLRTTSIELRDIVFTQPIVTSTDFDVDIMLTLSMNMDEGQGQITIHSRKVPKDSEAPSSEVLNMECKLCLLGGKGPVQPLQHTHPLPSKNTDGLQTWDMDQIYQLARQADIQHFSFMKNHGDVFRQGQMEWMDIRLSSLAEQYLDKFHAHVALLDGATFAGSSFRLGNVDGLDAAVPPYIPFMIERFVIYDRFPAEIRTFTEQTPSDLSGGDIISRSIAVTDREGRLLAEFVNLKAKRVRHAVSITGLTNQMTTGRNDKPASEAAIAESSEWANTTQLSAGSQDQVRTTISAYVKAEIARMLNTLPEAVDEHAGFYEQGLDSMHLLELVKRIENRVNMALYPTLLFEHSSVQALTEYLHTHCSDAWNEAAAVSERVNLNTLPYQSSHSTDEQPATHSEIPATAREIEGKGEPVCYEPKWIKTLDIHEAESARHMIADGKELQSDLTPYRIVVLYGNYPDLAAKLELQSDIYEVHQLPDHLSMDADLYRQKVTALYGMIQAKAIHPNVGRRIVLQVLSDSRDTGGYIHGFEGMVKTAAMELPAFGAQLIRMDLHESSMDETLIRQLRLEAENISSGSAVSIWYKGDSLQRHVRKLVEIPVPGAVLEKPYKPGGVYLITGGMGGLGYALAVHLSRQCRCKLVLIGRSPLNENIQRKLNPLRINGAEAMYIQADTTVQAELEKAVLKIRDQYGGITGVFHCAGTAKDQFMLQKPLSDLEQVLKPKMDGLWNLEQAFVDLSPEFTVAFSSLSAIVGNKGQADYAVANSCMDRLLLNHQERGGTNGTSTRQYTINWPLWADGGMQVNDHIRSNMYTSSGSMPLPLAEGMALIDRIVAQDVSQVVLLYGNKSRIQSVMGDDMAIHMPPPSDPEDIAVIGMAGRYPSANNMDELARILKEGRDCITPMPDERWAGLHLPYSASEYYPVGGFLDMIDDFDPAFFQISPLQAERMDPQARLFLQSAWAACEDAGFAIQRDKHHDASAAKRNVGVFAGVFWNHYELLGAALTQQGTPTAMGSNASAIANLVSYHLNFHGPSIAVDSMCSSSLTAIHLACESIRHGQSQYAIAGGVNLVTHPHKYVFLKQAKFLSSDGRCRSFGKDGDGYVPSEGVGAVLLTTVAEARKQGYPVYGVIKGSALNHAGKTSGTTVPDPVAQSEVIADALVAAGVEPGTIGYIEAHGTGTSLGDPIEIQGLDRAFRNSHNPGRNCAVGSLKSNIGHLEAAAGVAGLTKLILQIKHRELFPSLHAKELNPLIPFEDTCFYVQRTTQRWERRHGQQNGRYAEWPVRAGLSSFGASGSNAHLIVEEYIPTSVSWTDRSALDEDSSGAEASADGEVVLPISARTQERLKEYAHQVRFYLENGGLSERLIDIAYTFQVGRTDMKYRIALSGSSHSELVEQIDRFLHGQSSLQQNSSEKLDEMTLLENHPSSQERLHQWAALWKQGQGVDWTALYEDLQTKPAIVRVPTYPFARNRYWIQAEDQSFGETTREKGLQLNRAETSSSEVEGAGIVQHINEASNPVTGAEMTPSFQENLGEEQVLSLLSQSVSSLLKVSIYDLDSDAEWAEYGFDSILFTELTDRLNRDHGLGLTPAIFFEHGTIRELAVHLLQNHTDKWTSSSATRTAPQPESFNAMSHSVPGATEREEPLQTSLRSTASEEEKHTSAHSHAGTGSKLNSGSELSSPEPIAIVGISAKFPMADNAEQFWQNLLDGKDCISEVPEERWRWQDYMGDPLRENGKTNVKHAGFMSGISEFDPLFFGISPKEAMHMDPQQRLLMMHVWKVIEDAGYAPSDLSGSAMGLFIGTGSSGYNVMLAQSNEAVEAYSVTATVPSVGPNRMSYTLNIHGPSQPVETSCSSSLVAIHRAVQAIRNGDCETAVAGGVNTILSVDAHISLTKAGMLSADGRCKTFSSEANGYGRGEGVGMIFLKKLSDAQRDHDHIYGLIRGSGENHGGKAGSLTAPNPKAQTALLKSVYARAGIDPSTINYIEAHGTGTPLGDPIEINALKTVFQETRADLSAAGGFSIPGQSTAYCGVGSVKTNIGHLELASGIAGVIKVLLQLKHRKLVPSLHAEQISPYVQLESSPFYVVRLTQEWERLKDGNGSEIPRRAGVSSFGFGGSNAHVILEEYIPPLQHEKMTASESKLAPVAIVLSAKSKERLREQMIQLSAVLLRNGEEDTSQHLRRIACTLQTGRQAMEYRAGFIAASITELKSLLDAYVQEAHLWTDSDESVHAQRSSESAKGHKLHLGSIAAHKRTAALFREDEELGEALQKWIIRRKYHKLLELWVQGVEIQWELLYTEDRPERISLPTYPFTPEKYWVGVKSSGIKESFEASNEEIETIPVAKVEAIGSTAPNPSVESEVRSIMSALLGIPPDDMDEHRSLEDYGMDSVLALQLLQHLQARISSDIGMEDLNKCYTLQDVISVSLNPTHPEDQWRLVRDTP
ncbi:SDR family NAD(P)-dependent oxidoreductase [Paenibacillus polymyxa]|uniref:SDR family NAD(P)-dependent oxidoreductase n=1 Tax=Paenibacillus polymyxa TaxID=1406 RepID=UPI001BEBA76A|nr:SDR family NAD(P)-dependent oxidoreductase [Paenibacillus polymyxa]MBT2282522.1 SDR family NAD(P)-dependent oxidoreductase [Paenibacillus polymyxa]